ncbi:MAG: capsular polysaccharide biosynthesis protein [Clostridia bacterium]|nr:capsular polysaccharide biosynthesis protein [Clostridia bacterium]
MVSTKNTSIISTTQPNKLSIDWHSHILPGIDDGSRNVEESISLLNEQMAQGVKIVVATPHFCANDESVESFLERRGKAFELLRAELPETSLEIRLGAEVKYYESISRLTGLKELRVEGSKILLLEMPMIKWTEYMLRELVELSVRSDIKIVLAHIERYLSFQKQDVWERLLEGGILMQANASFFTSFTSKHRALSLLQKGNIYLVGSDCHNMTSRSPKIGKASEIIQKKLGDEYINQMNEYGYYILEHK